MASLAEEHRSINPTSPRSRSFGGCCTCRSRHVKCDEQRPTCSTCSLAGLRCGGYEKSLFFDFGKASTKDGVARFRRPLLTEKERKRMVELLISSAPPETAFQLLSQIDGECENATALHHFEISRGPFGAFKLVQSQPGTTQEGISDDLEDIGLSQDLNQDSDNCLLPFNSALSPRSHDFISSIFDQPDTMPVSEFLDPFNQSWSTDRVQEIFDGTGMPEMRDFLVSNSISETYDFSSYVSQGSGYRVQSPNPLSSLLTVNTISAVPQDTVLLLNHYVTTVITSLTPFRHSKTPWHVLFLPLARSCLAALTLGECPDDANMCVFYGTLAISAFSLGGVTQSRLWLNQAEGYKQQAREYVRSMLKSAYSIPKAAKYKSVLMALITMVQVSMFSGTRNQTECYLLEAEKFIRLRGLKRHKSRKVRLLHHCYVYTRIFHESTIICGLNSNQRDHVRKAVETSGLVVYGQDNLSFRLMQWNNLDQEMMTVKSQEEGENDLHLGQPGVFPATLYPEIYGVSEPWFYLLSQVIRLGNEKDAIESLDNRNSPSLKEFLSQAKTVERRIFLLQRPSQMEFAINGKRETDRNVLERIFDVMQTALAIYFYRRIYDVDASILQEKVVSVRDWLLRYEQEDPKIVYGSVGFVWPAFIAACEAEDPLLQNSFAGWFEKSATRYGLCYFTETLAIIKKVWQEKRNAVGVNVTWLDQMRKSVLLK